MVSEAYMNQDQTVVAQVNHAFCTFFYLGAYLKITSQIIDILQKKSLLIVLCTIAHLGPVFQ